MKIALFYPKNTFAGWYAAGGYEQALAWMGHEVLVGELPGNRLTAERPMLPPVDELSSCDLILSAYHEYVQPWLEAIYGIDAWQKLMATVPVIARFDESMDRVDLGLPERVPALLKWATHHAFPAAQDAEKYGGAWVPFGADALMFHPGPEPRRYDIGFIGSLYPKRTDYLQRLARELSDALTFKCGNVFVQDLSGVREPESTRLLAENYRQFKIFFCLPPLSRLLVGKVFDVMATDTLVMFPHLPGRCAANEALFEDGREIVYYAEGVMKGNANQIKDWLADDERREHVAKAGGARVRGQYTIEQMLGKLIGLAKPGEQVAFERPRAALCEECGTLSSEVSQ